MSICVFLFCDLYVRLYGWYLYIYIYIYIDLHIYIYICMYVCMHIYIYMYIYPDVGSVQVVEFDCVVVQVLIVCDCVSVCRLDGGGSD